MPHRKLNRLYGYDYSQLGGYFVTVCTQEGKHWFGKVVDGKMELNEYGRIAQDVWQQIPEHYAGVELGNYVVMPNHVHGIVFIVGTEHRSVQIGDGTMFRPYRSTGQDNVLSLQGAGYGKVSKIVKSYKEVCTKKIRRLLHNDPFTWQRSFYDHVIRNDRSLEEIWNYIETNPQRWSEKKII